MKKIDNILEYELVENILKTGRIQVPQTLSLFGNSVIIDLSIYSGSMKNFRSQSIMAPVYKSQSHGFNEHFQGKVQTLSHVLQ